jgi:hypothetical protein
MPWTLQFPARTALTEVAPRSRGLQTDVATNHSADSTGLRPLSAPPMHCTTLCCTGSVGCKTHRGTFFELISYVKQKLHEEHGGLHDLLPVELHQLPQ